MDKSKTKKTIQRYDLMKFIETAIPKAGLSLYQTRSGFSSHSGITMRFEYITSKDIDSINVHYYDGSIVSVSHKYFTGSSQIITIEFGIPIFHAYKFNISDGDEETKIIYGIFKEIFDFIVEKLSTEGRIMMTEKDYENYTEELFMGKPKEESK